MGVGTFRDVHGVDDCRGRSGFTAIVEPLPEGLSWKVRCLRAWASIRANRCRVAHAPLSVRAESGDPPPQVLRDWCRKHVEAVFADVLDRERGVISFANEDDLRHGIAKLDNTELQGRVVRVRVVRRENGMHARIRRGRDRSHTLDTHTVLAGCVHTA